MLRTFRENPRIILFAMMTAFFSGPGQSFLVSVFTPGMQSEFDLSSTEFGSLYSIATVGGAMFLPYLGKLLDRAELLKFTLLMAFFLAIGCLILSLAEYLIVVALGFLFIRCFGQGAMSLISSTTTSRHFSTRRGKALGLSSLGHPLAQAFFPLILALWVSEYGWRAGWVFMSLLILLTFMPTIFFLLRTTPQHKKRIPAKEEKPWRVGIVLKDWRFYVVCTKILVVPSILTALFLYQALIAIEKGWEPKIVASGFIAFAITRASFALGTGYIIDQFSGRKLLALTVIPLFLGLCVLRFTQHELWAFAYLGFAGMAVGMGGGVHNAFLAETYGTRNLGSIKGVMSFLMVAATAASPPILGWFLDSEFHIHEILNSLIVLSAGSVILGLICTKLYRPRRGKKKP